MITNDSEQSNNFNDIADLQDELLNLNFKDETELNLFTQKLLSSYLLNSKWTFRSVLVSIYTCYLSRPLSEYNYIDLFINIARHPNNSFKSDDYVANFSNNFFILQLYQAGIVTFNSIYMKTQRFERILDYFLPEIKENCPNSPLLTKYAYERMINSVVASGYQFNQNDIQSYLNKFIELRSKGQHPDKIAISIRNDDINSLQNLLSQTNTSVDSKIKNSLFERFIYLSNNEPTLIEYASYFGSIKCFKFLYQQIKQIPETISNFAIIGGNYEIIHYCEQSQVKFSDESLMTSIRFFRPEITTYLEETFNIEKTINDVSKSIVYYNLRSLIHCDEIIRNNPNDQDSQGYTPLSLAGMNGDLDIIKYLLTTYDSIDVNAKTKSGDTSLSFASLKGHYDIVKYLLTTQNIDINATNNRRLTALHLACECGNLNIVKFLCSFSDIDINADNSRKYRPIDVAARYGYIEIINFLSGLPNIIVYDNKCGFKSIIEYAVESSKIEVVKLVFILVDKSIREMNKDQNIEDFKSNNLLYIRHVQYAYDYACINELEDIIKFFKTEILGQK